MASSVPPKKNTAFTTYVFLTSQSQTNTFQASPTLATDDVKVCIDDGAPVNLATLPVVDADHTKRVKVSLSASEMNGDVITVLFSDTSGDEWKDLTLTIHTSAQTLDELDTVVDGLNDPTAATIADAVWDESTTGHTTSGTFGEQAKTDIDAILADTGTDGVVISTAQAQAIADIFLERGVANTEDNADSASLTELILAALEASRSSTTMTIRKTGGDTFSTRTLTLDSDADPVTGVT